jgi:hypothetical protein
MIRMLCSFSYLILLALRDILSYTYSKQAHFNAVVNQIRRNGPGGVEPTTSADMQSLVVPYLLKDGKAIERTAQPFLSG